MIFSGRFLYRAMASHLAVAVPPAVVLGLMIMSINKVALKLEAQQLHLSVSNQMRTLLSSKVQRGVSVLEHADRVLNMEQVPIEGRKELLKAMVAAGQLPYLALYKPDGSFDSLFRTNDEPMPVERGTLPQVLRDEAKERGWALGNVRFEQGKGRAVMIVPWTRDKETLGFVGTLFSCASLSESARELAERYLGDSGELDVIDGDGRYIASSVAGRVSHQAGSSSPFAGHKGRAREGLTTIGAGRAQRFIDERQEGRLGTIVSAPELRWVVGSSRTESIAYASLEAVKKRTLALSLVAALAAGLVGLLMARGVSEPVRKMGAQVRTSAQSGFNQAISAVGSMELRQLGHAFNEVLKQLEHHRKQLRSETQMRVRLARFLSPTALHQLFATEHQMENAAISGMISVLYADISASSQLSHRVTEQQLVSILGEFFDEACDVIEKTGGRVDRYSGDAIIGVFPSSQLPEYPKAAFDAAAALLRVSKEVNARWRGQISVEFGASVGLVTGEGQLLTHPGTQEISVAGALVERAATLQSSAKEGAVLVDNTTKDALEAYLGKGSTPLPGPTLNDQKVFQIEPKSDVEVES